MTEVLIGYNDIINKSMISVVIDVLKKIKKNNGLPGEHHIYLTFLTNEKGVTISVSYTHLTLPTNREV